MSLQVRQALVASPLTRFSSVNPSTSPDAMRNDLLDPTKTNTFLIALLVEVILTHNIPFEFTMIRTGHGNDGPHGHFGGFAVDGWPLDSPAEGDFTDAGSPAMRNLLVTAAKSHWLRQIGLGGHADTPANMMLAGPTAFQDNNTDHIHLGSVVQ
jgi:hypothetical protein